MIIDSDLFDIVDRVKEIDPSYFIVFNNYSKKYELHANRPDDSSYILTFPYEKMDARMVEHTRRTRTERIDSIIAEIDNHNRDKAINAQKNAMNMIEDQIKANF